MLINVDAKGLEWVCAAFLSDDKVAKDEIINGKDIHSDNQRVLVLPSRLISKIFLFRTIYCDEERGGAYGFANDPEFAHVSTSEKWWQAKIDAFFDKYKGLKAWHAKLMQQVGSTGTWTSPTKRTYVFTRRTLKNGDRVYPKPIVYNWPVQGLGADLMSIARVSLFKRLSQLATMQAIAKDIKLVCTVHDSILLDAPTPAVTTIVPIIEGVFNDVPRNFKKLFGVEFDLPFKGEIEAGPTWGNMYSIDKEILQNAYPSN